MTKVLVPLANGFEEIEALTVVDILRRAEIEVILAAVEGSGATGRSNITVACDTALDDLIGKQFDMVVLPGGMPGAQTLKDDARVQGFVKDTRSQGGHIAAICAAPMAFAHLGLLDGRRATSYPGFLDGYDEVEYTGARLERDGRIITARGPGVALDFSLLLIEVLKGGPTRNAVENQLQR